MLDLQQPWRQQLEPDSRAPVLLTPLWIREGDDRKEINGYMLIEPSLPQTIDLLERVQRFQLPPSPDQEARIEETPPHLLSERFRPGYGPQGRTAWSKRVGRAQYRFETLHDARMLAMREGRVVEVMKDDLPEPGDGRSRQERSWKMLIGPDQIGFQIRDRHQRLLGSGAVRLVELFRQLLYHAHTPEAIQEIMKALTHHHHRAAMEIVQEGLAPDLGDFHREAENFQPPELMAYMLAHLPTQYRETLLRISQHHQRRPSR